MITERNVRVTYFSSRMRAKTMTGLCLKKGQILLTFFGRQSTTKWSFNDRRSRMLILGKMNIFDKTNIKVGMHKLTAKMWNNNSFSHHL